MASARTAATVERLRGEIERLQAAPRAYVAVLRTRMEALDGLLPAGGFALGEAVELCGEAASGRTSLALRAVAAAHREGRLCAYVDGPGELYPPCAAALGVDLKRLLIVRPKGPGQLVWSAVQLLRSGAFACVVLDLTHTGVRLGLAEARKLQDAAQRGGTLLLLLTPPDAPGDGLLRLTTRAEGVQGLSVEIARSRRGRMGERILLPWDALYPGAPPAYRYRFPGELPEEVPRRAPALVERQGAQQTDASWAVSSGEPVAPLLTAGTGEGGAGAVPARQRRGLPREPCGGWRGFSRQRPGRDDSRHVLGPLLLGEEGGGTGERP